MRNAEREARTGRSGAALLEVIAAVTILATAGLSLVALTGQGVRAVREAAERELELADVERLLTAHTLLTREDLDIRLGTRERGPYLVEIQRPAPALYRIAIRRRAVPEVEELVTVVYRPGGGDGR